MKPADRLIWIEKWLRSHPDANILDSDFVDAYCEATEAPYRVQMVVANSCKQLGRDLSRLFKEDRVRRGTVGIWAGYTGMPKWVWSYYL